MPEGGNGELFDLAWKRSLRRRLKTWFARHARDLPWRRSADPYQVWVSEIMLQQTQVATVIPYHERFLRAFPTIEALARADESEVLRHWEGLGYYRRARQMHQAARRIIDEHGGVFPADSATLQSLPGIGRYTAGAILSIALDQRQPILEANTIRVWSRLLAYRGDPASSSGQRLLWRAAQESLPSTSAGNFNQALMELGSEVCTPREPACDCCPIAALCPTQSRSLQNLIPAAKQKTSFEDALEACVVVWRKGQVLLRRCQDGERWAGLWDFPRFAITSSNDTLTLHRELQSGVQAATGVVITPREQLTTIKHGVTRFRITLRCYEADYVRRRQRLGQTQWVRPKDLETYPLSSTGRRICRQLP